MIRLSKSCISHEDILSVSHVLEDEFLGMGAFTKRFESALSDYCRNKVLAVSSGTAALQLALQACGIGHNDEVLVPSLTYLASYQAISASGARPISCDINLSNLQIDLTDASNRISSNTKAIMPVHYGGQLVDRSKYFEFAKRHNLRVVEDAAHSFGSYDEFGLCGSYCDIICFSFDGIKNITCGEGGAVVTPHEDVYSLVSDYRLLGVKNDSIMRYKKQRTWAPSVESQGWRYHLSNINAGLGLSQFSRKDKLFKRRQHLSALYSSFLSTSNFVTTILPPIHSIVPHIYPILLPISTTVQERDALRSLLLDNYNIESGCHYYPNHYLAFYSDISIPPLPVTDSIYPRLLSLPLHPDLSDSDVQYVCESLLSCFS